MYGLKAKANEQYQPYQNLIIELKFLHGMRSLCICFNVLLFTCHVHP